MTSWGDQERPIRRERQAAEERGKRLIVVHGVTLVPFPFTFATRRSFLLVTIFGCTVAFGIVCGYRHRRSVAGSSCGGGGTGRGGGLFNPAGSDGLLAPVAALSGATARQLIDSAGATKRHIFECQFRFPLWVRHDSGKERKTGTLDSNQASTDRTIGTQYIERGGPTPRPARSSSDLPSTG